MKLTHLLTITEATDITQLTEEQMRELQTALSLIGYPIGDIDGLMGPKTRNAWGEFKADVFVGNPDLIEPESVGALQDVLPDDGGAIIQPTTKQEVIEAIKRECKALEIGLNTQMAYVLATVEWETGHTFKPVKEAYQLSEEWRRNNLRYYPYYGRGYVQLTWKNNYEKYSKILGEDLVNNPDLALDHHIALRILVHGFKTGTFTGRKITDYITSTKTDFVNARRCINRLDHAHDIAQLAEKHLRNL